MAKQFIWLGPPQLPRKGPVLKTNQTYKTSDFAEGVPDEWVKTKFAKWAPEAKDEKSKEEKK